jgi:hypothetical protein
MSQVSQSQNSFPLEQITLTSSFFHTLFLPTLSLSGVAAGPGVEKLSTGDYLFIYNIDTGFPYHPSYLGRCAVGWAILDSHDPSIIISRAPVPLLTSTYLWETCGGESGKGPWPLCQEPEVVFATGLKPLGNDEFLVIYGGADSVVGVAQVAVTVL